jgi:hypothetical protein
MQDKMQFFLPGDLCHYYSGSDVIPVVVSDVSRNGKTVEACRVNWTRNENDKGSPRVGIDDVTVTSVRIDSPLVFKSRKGAPHKEPGKYGRRLLAGFASYRDPSF